MTAIQIDAHNSDRFYNKYNKLTLLNSQIKFAAIVTQEDAIFCFREIPRVPIRNHICKKTLYGHCFRNKKRNNPLLCIEFKIVKANMDIQISL